MPRLTVFYTVSLFLSAMLLFSVQPMVGKYLLPLMGGGPSVWNTAMVFFQMLLLGGYAYAHAMARYLPVRKQMITHGILFITAGLSLPLALAAGADPTGHNPFLWQLTAMFGMAAAPFFILSSTAPLLQHWFAHSRHERSGNPYFLYAASNAGSLLGLLAYPFLIEPTLTLHNQSLTWSGGYILLGLVIAVTAFLSKPESHKHRLEESETAPDADKITWKRRTIWLLLAFVPSSLMLGLTSYITTDVTTVPLFWVVPLALYILSFVIAFSEKPFFPLPLTRILQGGATVVLLVFLVLGSSETRWSYVIVHLIFFFFSALLCHQELSALKPKSRHLTEFYLLMSVGGALGGLFNSLLAPLIFLLPFEYTFAMMLLLFCRYMADQQQDWATFKTTKKGPFDLKRHGTVAIALILAITAGVTLQRPIDIIAAVGIFAILLRFVQTRWAFAFISLIILAFNPSVSWLFLKDLVSIDRNYYGVVRVWDAEDVRFITHGTTNHGGQILNPENKFKAIGYYGSSSGLHDAFSLHPKDNPIRVGVIGLGAGSIACFFGKEKDHFDYFEIDPAVIKIAEDPELFTFLSGCHKDYAVHMGDGRLLLSKQPDASYDMIVIDAFSSDNIPVHVMTKEAIEAYKKKLKPGGTLVFHVSNRFFNLEYELAAIAKDLGTNLAFKFSSGDFSEERSKARKESGEDKNPNIVNLPTKYVVLTDSKEAIAALEKMSPEWKPLNTPESWKPWTDDYASILRSMVFQ